MGQTVGSNQNTDTGREMLSLEFAAATPECVVFSKDGARLAAPMFETGTIRIWDARPWSKDVEIESLSRGALQFLTKRAGSLEELRDRIKESQSLSKEVKERSMEWSERFWNARDGGRAVKAASSPGPAPIPLDPIEVRPGEWIPPYESGAPLRKRGEFDEISRQASYKIQSGQLIQDRNKHAALLLSGADSLPGFVFHTTGITDDPEANAPPPGIIIRLPDVSTIAAIRISNRRTNANAEQLRDRAAGLSIWISDDESNWRQVWQAESAEYEWLVELKDRPRAKFIKIGLPTRGVLHLREVVVFGR